MSEGLSVSQCPRWEPERGQDSGTAREPGGGGEAPFLLPPGLPGVTCIFLKSLWVKKGTKPSVCSASMDTTYTTSNPATAFLETIARV